MPAILSSETSSEISVKARSFSFARIQNTKNHRWKRRPLCTPTLIFLFLLFFIDIPEKTRADRKKDTRTDGKHTCMICVFC